MYRVVTVEGFSSIIFDFTDLNLESKSPGSIKSIITYQEE
jgi:hypothetical protein